MAKKKKDEKWMSVGNYLLGIDTNKHGSYVVLRTVAGTWSIRWHDDTMMYPIMTSLMVRAAEDANVMEYLHSLLTLFFISTTYTHDLLALATKQQMPLMDGFAKLLAEQNEYELSLKDKPTEEDEEKALQEEVEMQDVLDELEKLEEENK